jgi:hypothetical protein
MGHKGGKFGYGLWGGVPGEIGDGSIPSEQTGFLVRNVRSGEEDRPNYTTNLYSYVLNRSGTATTGGKVYGSYSAKAPVPKGRWLHFEMEMRVNDVAWANGYTRLWQDGRQYAEMTN